MVYDLLTIGVYRSGCPIDTAITPGPNNRHEVITADTFDNSPVGMGGGNRMYSPYVPV